MKDYIKYLDTTYPYYLSFIQHKSMQTENCNKDVYSKQTSSKSCLIFKYLRILSCVKMCRIQFVRCKQLYLHRNTVSLLFSLPMIINEVPNNHPDTSLVGVHLWPICYTIRCRMSFLSVWLLTMLPWNHTLTWCATQLAWAYYNYDDVRT